MMRLAFRVERGRGCVARTTAFPLPHIPGRVFACGFQEPQFIGRAIPCLIFKPTTIGRAIWCSFGHSHACECDFLHEKNRPQFVGRLFLIVFCEPQFVGRVFRHSFLKPTTCGRLKPELGALCGLLGGQESRREFQRRFAHRPSKHA